jgi:acyl-CoA synthetase (NDP forming)
MTEPEAFEVFRAYRLPLPGFALARSRDEALAAAERIGFPVVLKVVSPDIVHKFDVGGVRVNLKTADDVAAAHDAILRGARETAPAARVEGVFVQEFVPDGIETIVGAKRDPHFGPILMFGLGGTAVEIFRDVTFRIAPIREGSALRMIRQIRGFPLLDGFRGQPKADLAALAEVLLRLSQLVTEHEEIEELDVNPLKVLPEGKGAMALDGRLFLSRQERRLSRPDAKMRQGG